MAIKTVTSPLAGYKAQRLTSELERTEAKRPHTLNPETDRVSLSEEGRRKAAIRSAAAEADGVRTDKVAELKAQVAAGTYAPKSKDIAAAIVRHDLDLWG